ncbi:hypothetical protein RhiirC2_777811 [Rhizophagus irregularis]|uniref:Reverse transcriptase domain-containing protein n=1 Tax=Rhizophagus irregularis TaxID=588596 RepID=A0A2N1NDB5_9GLOM|nr:hypothetical protein RhiirC2_777811 [Rhizophagus irregularis]
MPGLVYTARARSNIHFFSNDKNYLVLFQLCDIDIGIISIANNDDDIRSSDEEIDEYLTFNTIAFMDDTTLISRDKISLEKMIKICHEFFTINDIQVDIKKNEFIKINSFYLRHDNKRKNMATQEYYEQPLDIVLPLFYLSTPRHRMDTNEQEPTMSSNRFCCSAADIFRSSPV